MKRKQVIALGILMSMLGVTGCGTSEVARLNNLQSLNSESTVNTYQLTTSEKEEAVYSQVVQRKLLDLSKLDACSETEKQQVVQFMNNVDAQLTGSVEPENGVLDESYSNYLLYEFQKTPYYWQRASTNIRGIDAESRSIVVDVTYKTINFSKDVKSASYLVQGEPDYDKKMEVRFTRWLNILESKNKNGYSNWEEELTKFREVYGEPSAIFESQKNESLSESNYHTGNQLTYTGLIDSEVENTHATMTVRYILENKYVLGVNVGMQCTSMYRTDYEVANDPTDGLELFKDEGYATISDNVYDVIYSYFTCIDESDFNGLYELTKDFSGLDKHYEDYFNTTYRKHEGFTVSLFDIKGTSVTCGVSISSKVRAKGSNISSPLYTDRYLVQLELTGNRLQVSNLVLLSSVLEGEPTINKKVAETTGFVSKIDLSTQDKKDIENLIAEFSAMQLLEDTTSDKFGELIDTSLGQSAVTTIKENMNSVKGDKKVVWLTNYMQGTTNFASVKCKEMYQKGDENITETDVTYTFINKGNKWYIYGYDINSSIKLDTNSLATTGSLCVCTAGRVDVLNSQVQTGVQNTENKVDENVGTVYKHDAYTPVLKNGQSATPVVPDEDLNGSDNQEIENENTND